MRLPADRIEGFLADLFRAVGVVEDVARLTAGGLTSASLRGVDSHGIRLAPHYIAAIEGGRVNPTPTFRFEKTGASTGILDADHTFGHAAGIVAIRHAIDLARDAGSGHVAVKNSSHCGALAYFGLEPPKADMIGLAYTHASPKMRSAGGRRAFFGANPICFTAPMAREGPFCFDSSSTVLSANTIRLRGEEGKTLPPGVAADAAGEETRDPAQFEQLLPIGDYKGFGIGMIVDILCGLLSGMPAGNEVSQMFETPLEEKRFLGQFYGAIRIDAYEDPRRFKERLQELADRVRREPRRDPAIPVQVAGDPEKANEADRREKGIPVRARDLGQLNKIAEHFGMTLLGE